MIPWRDAPLEELVTLQRGFDIARRELRDGPYPVISSGGVIGMHDTPKAHGPGVLVGRKGTLGTVHYVHTDYFPHSTSLWSRDLHGNNPRYVYYFLKTLHLERFDVGAANPTLNRNHIHGLPVRIPPIPIQDKIAAALAAHDELIDNNRRRIEILEQMAQAIYRELLVSLVRSYQSTPAVREGIALPPDWNFVKISSVADARRGLSWSRDQETNDEDAPGVVTIPNIGDRLDPQPRKRLSQISEKQTSAYLLQENDILMIGSNGNPQRVGQTVRVPANVPLLFASFLMRIRPRPGVAKSLLFHQLRDSAFTEQLRAGAIGSTGLRNIRITALRDAELPMPPPYLRDEFEDIVAPMHALSDSLDAQNRNLAQTRDALLPKLTSGEIDVSKLDIDTSWLTA